MSKKGLHKSEALQRELERAKDILDNWDNEESKNTTDETRIQIDNIIPTMTEKEKLELIEKDKGKPKNKSFWCTGINPKNGKLKIEINKDYQQKN